MAHRLSLLALGIALCMIPNLALAQQPPPVNRDADFQMLVERLERTERNLQQTQQELASLRRDQQERSDITVNRSPATAGHYESASFTGGESFEPAEPFVDGSGKSACEGLPNLCGTCLEDLGWNKKNGWRIVPFGRLRGEAIYSTAPQTGGAVIVFLNPRNPGVSEDTTTVHAKQSQVNFRFNGPNIGDWQTGGLILGNFMGSAPLRNFSGYNIVNAYGEVKNERWRFAFGRMLDLFGPIAPKTVNQISQRGAGDIGIYRGAFHVDRYLTFSDVNKWTLSARISQQDISDYGNIPAIRGKDNGWPNIEARIGFELGPACDYGRPLEMGVSAVWGETQAVADTLLLNGLVLPGEDDIAQTRGVALDFQLKGERFGFRSEVWWGQAAGTYFIAALQSLNPETAQAIQSMGGWAELYYKVNPCLTMHVGYGVDDPKDEDLGFVDRVNVGVGQISYNDVAWWNAIWDVTDYFELAFEVSHRRTKFIAADAANEGTLFHFASTLKF